MTPADTELKSEAISSLERMQSFDPESLAREDELGSSFNFRKAVEPAGHLVELYSRLPASALDDFPNQQLTQVRDRANQDFQQLDEILKFDPKQQDATATHKRLLDNLANNFQPTFTALHPFISYSLQKTVDFQRLEGDARAALQSIRDQSDKIREDLEEKREAAERVLQDVRRVAAESGVTQQAIYFKESADEHDEAAVIWLRRTIWVSVGLGLYAVASMFFHKVPWLEPSDTYQTVQITVSKFLIFAVISYVLYLCARNMLSHRHNAIVDRHRQNALLTYKALVDAAGETPNREVILVQAAACIFSPRGTGYSSDSVPPPPGAHSVVEFMSKPLKSGDQ